MARRANSARQFFAPQFQIQFEKVGAVTAQIGGVEFTARGAGTTVNVRQVFPRWEALTPAQQELMRPRMGGAKEGWTQSLRHLGDYVKR